jgi:hypothetical protein
MSSLASIGNVPATAKVGNLELKFGKVTLRMIARFEQWAQSTILRRAKNNLDGLPADLQSTVMAKAVEEANRCTMTSPLGQLMAQSMEGAAQLLFLVCEPHTPNITVDLILDNLDLQSQALIGELLDGSMSDATKAAKKNPT